MQIKKSILIITEEPIIYEDLSRYFIKNEFNVLFSSNYNDSLERFHKIGEICLLLIEINTNLIETKFNLIQEITKSYDIPAILLTNSNLNEFEINTEISNVYSFIDKKTNPSIILANINNALKLHQYHLNQTKKEKSLVDTIDLMQNILDCSSDFIFVKNRELRTILCNDMVAKSVGRKVSDLIGHNDIENGVDIELVKGNPEKGIRGYENDDLAALNGATIHNPMDLVYTADKVYVFDTIKRPIINKNGETLGIIGISRDITETKKAQDEFIESEKRFRMLFNEMLSGFTLNEIIFDKNENPINYRFLEVNPMFEKLTGLKRNDIIGKTIYDIFPKTAEHWLQIFAPVSMTGKGIKFEEYSQELKKYFSINAFSFTKGYFATVFEDITQSKYAAKIIASEREQLKVTLHSIGEGVITTDTNGLIVIMNKVAQELTEWNLENAIGKPLDKVFKIIHEISKEPFENPVYSVIKSHKIMEMKNHTCLITATGKELIIANSAAPILDIENNITGVVIVFRDMTEKIKNDAMIQRNQNLESIGLLAGGIAHDFNNILAGIFGYIEIALTFAKGNERIILYLNKALTAFQKAKALTRQLITFSKGGAPIKKIVAISSLIKASVQFSMSGSNLSVNYDLAENLWLCEIDEHQIGQVIDNLIINAKQAMPNGGNINIKAENISLDSKHFIRISIQDFGFGIAKENLSRIFDPFFSTKSNGTGLGLSTALSILQKHGGFIDVESKVEVGTTFFLYLPASDAKKNIFIDSPINIHRGTGKVLIMDDDLFIQETESFRMSSLGYDVSIAKNGDEAIRMYIDAKNSNEPFDFLILDLTIPGGKGGIKTIEEIRQYSPDTIAILASGYAESPAIAHPTDYGFNASLKKPYSNEEFIEIISKFSIK